MSSFHLKTILTIALLLPVPAPAQDSDVKAAVAVSIQQGRGIWVGQQITLNLDLKTSGLSFSNAQFNLPDVAGAFLMQTDTTTVKLTETVDGQNWQILRYPLALYPQKAGLLEIPPIDVRFNTSAGFGSTDRAFEFQTRPLELTIEQPAGVAEGDLVVTTTSFELDHNWQPESGPAKTGDAFTLTVSRRASDISAMLLTPLPVFQTEGLAAYPQAPEVSDKSNRGDLTGERIDSIIWVVEKPGSYAIPGIRFQWWDPSSRELKQQIVAGLSLDIPPSPADKASVAANDEAVQSGLIHPWLPVLIFTAFLAVFLWFRVSRGAKRQAGDTEKPTFAALQKACRNNDIAQTHSSLHAWLTWSAPVLSPNSRPVTLGEFAQACNNTQLTTELHHLQEALICPDGNWQGYELHRILRRIRARLNKQKTMQQKTHLAPLNP